MDSDAAKLLLLLVTSPLWWRVVRAFRQEFLAFLEADAARHHGEGWLPDDERAQAIDTHATVRTRLATWEAAEDPTWSRTRLVNRAWDTGRAAHPRPPAFRD